VEYDWVLGELGREVYFAWGCFCKKQVSNWLADLGSDTIAGLS